MCKGTHVERGTDGLPTITTRHVSITVITLCCGVSVPNCAMCCISETLGEGSFVQSLKLDPKTRLQLCCFGLSEPENIKDPWHLHNAGRGIVGNR